MLGHFGLLLHLIVTFAGVPHGRCPRNLCDAWQQVDPNLETARECESASGSRWRRDRASARPRTCADGARVICDKCLMVEFWIWISPDFPQITVGFSTNPPSLRTLRAPHCNRPFFLGTTSIVAVFTSIVPSDAVWTRTPPQEAKQASKQQSKRAREFCCPK